MGEGVVGGGVGSLVSTVIDEGEVLDGVGQTIVSAGTYCIVCVIGME